MRGNFPSIREHEDLKQQKLRGREKNQFGEGPKRDDKETIKVGGGTKQLYSHVATIKEIDQISCCRLSEWNGPKKEPREGPKN